MMHLKPITVVCAQTGDGSVCVLKGLKPEWFNNKVSAFLWDGAEIQEIYNKMSPRPKDTETDEGRREEV